jgi:hypothetical protein
VESSELELCTKKICSNLTGWILINIRIKFFLFAGTLIFFLALRFQGKELYSPHAPNGIISLELASNGSKVQRVMDGWKEQGLVSTARNNIWLDFLFIPFYVMLFYSLCGNISVRLRFTPAKLGVLLAFFSLIAGIFDVFENILMMAATYGAYNDLTAFFTTLFAYAKLLLLSLSLVYVIIFGTVAIWLRRRR